MPLAASLPDALACGFVAACECLLACRFEWFASPHGQAWLGCTECLRRSRALTLPSCDGTCGMSPFCRSPLTPRICEHIRLMNPVDFRTGVCLAPTENRPSLTIGGIRDRRFQFLLYRQTSAQECVLQRTTSATGADIRRRPSLPIRWRPHCRRLFIAVAFSTSQH